MRIACFAMLLLALLGCGGLPKPLNVSQAPSPAPGTRFLDPDLRRGTVFVGDSIVGRMNLDEYFPGMGYVNAGWFGRRTDQVRAVFPQILGGQRVCHGYSDGNVPEWPFVCRTIRPPAEVVIFLGWNDLLQSRNANLAAADIRAMAQMAQDSGVQVVLVEPYRWDSAHPVSWMAPWEPFNGCSTTYPWSDSLPVLNSGIEQAGADLHVKAVISLNSLYSSNCQSDYTIDGLHPAEGWPGYQQMADFMRPSL